MGPLREETSGYATEAPSSGPTSSLSAHHRTANRRATTSSAITVKVGGARPRRQSESSNVSSVSSVHSADTQRISGGNHDDDDDGEEEDDTLDGSIAHDQLGYLLDHDEQGALRHHQQQQHSGGQSLTLSGNQLDDSLHNLTQEIFEQSVDFTNERREGRRGPTDLYLLHYYY